MRFRVLIGAVIAAMLVGLGVLAGTVVGGTLAAAQTSTTTPSTAPKADTTPAPSTNPANPGNPDTDRPGMRGRGGMRGGFGGFGGNFGPGGRGGFGGGDFGAWGGSNANAATREISNTTSLITQVKADLAYANGKMDTTDVQRWVNGADSLLKSAQSANSSSQYGQASAYARAAAELAQTADLQMAQKLGADKLPSYSQRPQRPNGPANPNGTSSTITQAQASRVLQSTYNRLIEQGAVIKNATSAGDAAIYLTDAQNAYKAAYNAYQAGNYSDAAASARLADQLAGVSNAVLQAAAAPKDSNTPVTVPAPNFQ